MKIIKFNLIHFTLHISLCKLLDLYEMSKHWIAKIREISVNLQFKHAWILNSDSELLHAWIAGVDFELPSKCR